MKFKFIPHTADIKFQAFGKDASECFENAGYALKEIICKEKINPVKKRIITVNGKDMENLLYNFLEEFIYLLDIEGFIAGKIESISIIAIPKSNKKYSIELKSVVYGDDINNYKPELGVKAVTYNDMFAKYLVDKKTGEKNFVCQVVVDV